MKVNYNQPLSSFLDECVEKQEGKWNRFIYSMSIDRTIDCRRIWTISYWEHHAKRLGYKEEEMV
jgi:hypothetical protein